MFNHAQQELSQKIVDSLVWNLGDEIQKIAAEFFNEEIAPEIKAQLAEGKAEIIEAIKEALLNSAKKNIEHSWNKGIQLLDQYRDNPGGYKINAEHDVIHAYETPRPLSPDDVQKMINYGWFQEDVEYSNKEFTVDSYNPNAAWVAYA